MFCKTQTLCSCKGFHCSGHEPIQWPRFLLYTFHVGFPRNSPRTSTTAGSPRKCTAALQPSAALRKTCFRLLSIAFIGSFAARGFFRWVRGLLIILGYKHHASTMFAGSQQLLINMIRLVRFSAYLRNKHILNSVCFRTLTRSILQSLCRAKISKSMGQRNVERSKSKVALEIK